MGLCQLLLLKLLTLFIKEVKGVMAKKVAQVRYYGPKDIKNYPKDNNTKNRYVSGNIFNQYYPIKAEMIRQKIIIRPAITL